MRLWAHIALRAAQGQAALLLALPTLLVALGVASGQPVTAQGWLSALSLTWPAAQALALTDRWASLRRDGSALAYALLGYRRRWLASALAVPALLLALTGAALSAHPAAPQSPRPTASLPDCAPLSDAPSPDAPSLRAQCEALHRAPLVAPPRATLRRLPWAALPHTPGGDTERLRRLLEPLLGLPLAALTIALTRRQHPTLAPIPRARALITTLLTLAIAHALWSLTLALL